MLKFEQDLLEKAYKNLEIISLIERNHLQRIKDDRNLCSHPTFSHNEKQFNPEPELVRSHIIHAAKYLLTLTPMVGKEKVEFVYNHIMSERFPNDESQALKVLKSDDYLGRAKDAMIKNLIISLFKSLVAVPVEEIHHRKFKNTIRALNAIEKIDSNQYKNLLTKKLKPIINALNSEQFKIIYPLLGLISSLWGSLDHDLKSQLKSVIDNMTYRDITKFNIPILSDSIKDIKTSLKKRIENMTETEKDYIITHSSSFILVKDAINLFSESGSYDSANSNMSVLLKYVSHIGKDDLNKIFESVKENNQILGGNDLRDFLNTLYNETRDSIINHESVWAEFKSHMIKEYWMDITQTPIYD